MPGRQKPYPPGNEVLAYRAGLRGYLVGQRFGGLNQIQLGCPFDGRAATIDVEFPVDALGMGADST